MSAAEDEAKWPGVDAAFGFVLPSYQWMLGRIEAADSRLHSMQVFVLTVTTAAPTLAKAISSTVDLKAPALVGALAFGVLSIVVGIVARSATRIMLLDPGLLYHKDWLRLSDWAFKYNMLHFASQHFASNGQRIVQKHRALVWMTGLFFCELLLLAIWFLASGA